MPDAGIDGECARAGAFARVPFDAAYLDGCGGAPAPLSAMVAAFFGAQRRLPRRVALGFTLTLADGGTQRTAGEQQGPRSLHDREQDVTRAAVAAARARGYSCAHVGDDPARYGVDEATHKRHGTTLAWWLAFEKKGP